MSSVWHSEKKTKQTNKNCLLVMAVDLLCLLSVRPSHSCKCNKSETPLRKFQIWHKQLLGWTHCTSIFVVRRQKAKLTVIYWITFLPFVMTRLDTNCADCVDLPLDMCEESMFQNQELFYLKYSHRGALILLIMSFRCTMWPSPLVTT